MSTLRAHIKSQPGKSMSAWATELGVSRPTLYAILDGSRRPSTEVAIQIASATGGAVPVSSWPHLSELVQAVKSEDAQIGGAA